MRSSKTPSRWRRRVVSLTAFAGVALLLVSGSEAALATAEDADEQRVTAAAEVEWSEVDGASVDDADAVAAPLAVPAVPDDHVIISVRVGGDRIASPDGESTIWAEGVEGVTLRLSSSATDPNAWQGFPWATCVSDADGDCNFIVPVRASGTTDAAGMRTDAEPNVHAVGAPDGYRLLQQLRTGHGEGADTNIRRYTFKLNKTVTAGSVYASTTESEFMIYSTSMSGTSAGYWQIARENPEIPQSCGLDYAVLIDLSSSIGSALPNAKGAVDSFVDALRGTPSRVALFSFDLFSPASRYGGYGPNMPEPRSVSTSAGGQQVRDSYSDWTLGGGTNWDIGLHTVATAPYDYDVVVVVTDGNPTAFGTSNQNPDNGAWNRMKDDEAGIFSANLVKESGARVVTVGVGVAASGDSDLNLQAISGPTLGSDYFQVGDYDEAGRVLAELARGNCEGSVTVEKRVMQPGTDVSSAVPAADWQFDAVSAAPSQVTVTGSSTQLTDDEGQAAFGLAYTDPYTSGAVTVTETQQEGHSLVQRDGKNAVCTNLETGQNVPVENAGLDGFTVGSSAGVQVHCVVVNQQAQPFVCAPGDVYSIDGLADGDGTIRVIDTATGASAPWGSFGAVPAGSQMNAFGIAAGGESAFALRREGAFGTNADVTVLKFDALAGTVHEVRRLTAAELNHGMVAGAVSPSDGLYWVAARVGPGEITSPGNNDNNIWGFTAIDPDSGEIVTRFTFDIGHNAANGDLEFDNAGNMYVVTTWGEGDVDRQNLWLIPQSTLAGIVENPGQQLTPYDPQGHRDGVRSLANPRPEERLFNSIAWGSDGYLYTASAVGDGSRDLHRVDPVTGVESARTKIIGGDRITDFGSCSNPNTLVVQKDIVERASPGDQFLLSLTGGGLQETIGITQGDDLGVQNTNTGELAGPVVVHGGQTYDFAESGVDLDGNPIADLAMYNSSWSCVDASQPGSAPLATGDGGAGSIQVPSGALGVEVVCTIENDPVPDTTFELEKWGIGTDGDEVLFGGSAWSVLVDDDGQAGDEILDAVTALDGDAGRFSLTLPPGTYWLVETQSPEGFQLLAEPVPFEVTPAQEILMDDVSASTRPIAIVGDGSVGFTIQVYDVPAFELPAAGGVGERAFHFAGALLLLAALMSGAIKAMHSRGTRTHSRS